MDIDQILPQLLAGECPKSTDDIDELRRDHDVTAILCLQTEDEFAQARVDWDRLRTHCRESEIEVSWVPVGGCDPNVLRRSLSECVRALDGLLRDGHKVYIHCSLGVSRAPTVVVAYLHWVQDWDFHEAMDYVTACRACDPQVEVLKLATEERRQAHSASSAPVSV